MDLNVITGFINYKINYLTQCGLLFFEDLDQEFIFKHLNQYITAYVNSYYYHKSETFDKLDKVNEDIILKELFAKRVELLDVFCEYELEMDNHLYFNFKKALIEMVEIVFFLSKVDRLRFDSKDDLEVRFNQLMEYNPKIKERLGNNLIKLFLKVKDNYNKELKILTPTGFYKTDYSKFIDNNLIYVSLYHDISILKTNYRNIFVDRVYKDNKYNLDKVSCLIWNISISILENIINGNTIDKYLIDIPDNLIYRNKFLLEEEFNNSLLKENVILVFNNNTYKDNMEIIKSLNHKVACSVDLSHINDVVDKLNQIEAMANFEYIFVTDYKDKDEDLIKNFKANYGIVEIIKEK